MVAFWIWLVVSGVISVIALCSMLVELSGTRVDDEFLVWGSRFVLLSWLWPLVIPWFLIMLALNRDPVSPTKKFVA